MITCCLFLSCAQDQEGCLDANGVNFDISADAACGSCCTYPSLSFSIDHKIVKTDTTLNMQYGTFYANDIGDSFAISEMKFFISNVALLQSDGTTVGVTDTISLSVCESNNISFEVFQDDFTLLSKNAFSFPVGTVNTSGDFTGLRFDVGLSALANTVLADSVATTHPLGITSDSMYVDKASGYYFNKILLATDEDNPLILRDFSITDSSNKVQVNLSESFTLERGLNTVVSLEVDYRTFFNGINFTSDSDMEIKNKIIQNTSAAIRLSN